MAGISKAERARKADLLAQGLKECHACNEIKPVSDFSLNRTTSDGLCAGCRTCAKEAVANWRVENPGYSTQVYRAKKNDATYKAQCREWQRASRARNPELSRRYGRNKRASDPLWSRIRDGAHKAKKLGCPIERFTSAELLAHWEFQGIDPTRCYYTGEALDMGTPRAWHLDHMTPLSRGGSHAVWNLVPTTASVNPAKGDSTAEEFKRELCEQ